MVPGLASLRDRFDAVLIDMDGTLLDGRSELSPRTHRAVRALADTGMKVVLCTGRSIAGTEPFHQALGLDTPMVTYNGSWIGYESGAPLHYLPIPDDLLPAIFEQETDARFVFRHHNEWKHTVMTEHPDHHSVAGWFEKVVQVEANHHLPDADIMRISMFFCATDLPAGDVESLLGARIAADVRERLRIECFPLNLFPPYADSSLHLYEVQGHSQGKAEAFGWLERQYGIPAARTIAIGDHRNDLTMLAGAGLAITPANGVPECQARAHLTIGHHAEEGLAAWLEAGAPLQGMRERAVDGEPAA